MISLGDLRIPSNVHLACKVKLRFGDLEKKSEEFRENVYSIRDHCMLVNTELVDYNSVSRTLKLLSQVAPA